MVTRTWPEDDPDSGLHGSIEERLEIAITVEVNDTARRIDQPHVSVDADGIQPCSFDFLEYINPQRGNWKTEGVEFPGARQRY
jgi:hypothetical protein